MKLLGTGDMPHKAHRGLSALVVSALVLFSPGLGCYQAVAATFQGRPAGPGVVATVQIPMVPQLPVSAIPGAATHIPGAAAALPGASLPVAGLVGNSVSGAVAPNTTEGVLRAVNGSLNAVQAGDQQGVLDEAYTGARRHGGVVGAVAAASFAESSSELKKLDLPELKALARDSRQPDADRRAAVKAIADRSDDPARLILEEIGTTRGGGGADYEIKRLALRHRADQGKLVSLPPVSEEHWRELLVKIAKEKPQAAFLDYDRTLEDSGAPASAETGAALKALSDSGVATMILTDRSEHGRRKGDIGIFESLETLTPEQRAAISVGSQRGARLFVFDKQGQPQLFDQSAPWTAGERDALRRAAGLLLRAYDPAGDAAGRLLLTDYDFAVFLPAYVDDAAASVAARELREMLRQRGLRVDVMARGNHGGAAAYLAMSKYDKGHGVSRLRALRQRLDRWRDIERFVPGPLKQLARSALAWLPSHTVPASATLLVGDLFFGEKNIDAGMLKGAPGALAIAVGGTADPRLDNVFVSPRLGHAASMEVISAAAGPAETPVSPEAKRTIKAFSWARTFSIAAYMIYMVAFSSMAIDVVGRQVFATVGIVSALASIPLAFVNGMLVDKLAPRQILMGGSALLSVVGVAAAYLAAHAHLITLSTLIPLSIITQFMLIAILVGEGSIVPKILGGNQKAIQSTNALFDLIFASVGVVGSLAGGWLVAHWLGNVGAFLTYGLVQLCIVLPIYGEYIPKIARQDQDKPGLGESFSIVWRSPYLLSLLGLSLAAIFLVFPLRQTLIPVIVKDYLHGSPELLGFLNTAIYSGMTLASLFNWFVAPKFANSTLLLLSASAFLAFGVIAAFPFSVTALFAGIALIFTLQTVAANVLRSLYMGQAQKEHSKFMGRLMGINSAMYGAATFTGTFLLKSVMGAASYPALLYGLAVPYVLAAVLYLLSPLIIRWAYQREYPRNTEDPLK